MLRLAPVVQLIEKAFGFLQRNTNFAKSNADDFTRSLLQDATIVEGKHEESAIKLTNNHQQQTHILRGDDDFNEIENISNEQTHKDVLLFKGSNIKGVSYLAKSSNPRVGGRCAALDYEKSFKMLAENAFGSAVSATGRNNRPCMSFCKKPLADTAKDAKVLDRWPKVHLLLIAKQTEETMLQMCCQAPSSRIVSMKMTR